MVFGTLVYAVVLGFFNDYTPILHIESFSTTFLVAVVMQVLTYLTFMLKNYVTGHFRQKSGKWSKAGMAVGVWLVLFLSKFVFLAAIEFVFSSEVHISGFVGLIAIIVAMTVAKEGIDHIFNRLGD